MRLRVRTADPGVGAPDAPLRSGRVSPESLQAAPAGRVIPCGMAKRIRITFCGATGDGPWPENERAITVRAEATETGPGVYAIDPATIVLDLSGNGTPAALGPTFQIEDV